MQSKIRKTDYRRKKIQENHLLKQLRLLDVIPQRKTDDVITALLNKETKTKVRSFPSNFGQSQRRLKQTGAKRFQKVKADRNEGIISTNKNTVKLRKRKIQTVIYCSNTTKYSLTSEI